MFSLSPLTPPPLHSLTNLYQADTVGEHSDVIQLKSVAEPDQVLPQVNGHRSQDKSSKGAS